MNGNVSRKSPFNAAESKTLSMRGNSLHGSRETLETPAPTGTGRADKANRRTSDMHASRESDGPIVPKKRANNAGREDGGGVRGGKGTDQGERQANLTRAGHSAAQCEASDGGAYGMPSLPEVRAV